MEVLVARESQIKEERLTGKWVSFTWLVTSRMPDFGFGVQPVLGHQALRHLLYSILQDSQGFSHPRYFIPFLCNPASHLHKSSANWLGPIQCHEAPVRWPAPSLDGARTARSKAMSSSTPPPLSTCKSLSEDSRRPPPHAAFSEKLSLSSEGGHCLSGH